MDCQTVQHHLSAYLDHDVPLFTRRLLDGHFARCAQCRCELTQFQTMGAWVRSYPTVEPSSLFLQQVCERVERLPERAPAPFFRRLVGAIPLQAAAALMVAVSAALLWQVTPALWSRQEAQRPMPIRSEPWMSQDNAPTPLMTPPPFDPPLEESFPMPAPLVQGPTRRPLFTSYGESGRMAREADMMPTMAWLPTEARVGEVSLSPSVILRAADPVQTAQQLWEMVPRMEGSLLRFQGMVNSAGHASRGPVRMTLTLGADRYQGLLEAIRQLPGTQVTEERVTFISHEPRPAPGGSLWRLNDPQPSLTSQMTLVLTILPR
jgi:hypothetical protein